MFVAIQVVETGTLTMRKVRGNIPGIFAEITLDSTGNDFSRTLKMSQGFFFLASNFTLYKYF